jgi:prepilin-type processing-associated H-X9-DG protein
LAVTDGLSNTIAFAESAGRPQLWQLGHRTVPDGPPFPPGMRSRLGGWPLFSNMLELAGINPAVTPPTQNFPGPCLVNCHNGQDIYSFHSGGANILMGDGTVRFLRQSTPYDTTVMLVVRNDGFVIPGDF